MCAIAGFSQSRESLIFDIKHMLLLQSHRGPDSIDFCSHPDWGIGVARLKITSPSEDMTQPLWSEDGRYCFVFNGEIYNYKSLKERLESSGHSFKTQSDGEVLFTGFLAQGENFLVEAQGMFAGAIWDSVQRSWSLFRDPAGIKPLYYYKGSDFFAFSSEIKALLPYIEKRINHKEIPNYLRHRYVSGGETLFQGLRKVLPGNILKHSEKATLQQKKYFNPQSLVDSRGPISMDELAETLRKSIIMTGTSDVGYASLLSGGLDSSLMAQVLIDQGDKPECYFFDNGYDELERESAQWFAQVNQLQLNSVFCSKSDYERLPEIICALEEPLGDSIIGPTDRLMESVGRQHRVVLSGEGADEIFAGYAHHEVFHWLKLGHKFIPKSLVSTFLENAPLSLLNRVLPYPGELNRDQFKVLAKKVRRFDLDNFKSLFKLFDDNDLSRLIRGEETVGLEEKLTLKNLDELLYSDFSKWLPDYNLLRLDKLSMKYSVEARLPYLNSEVILAGFRLSESDKVSLLGQRKKALSQIATDKLNLNKKISLRKKHPFTFKETLGYQEKYESFCNDFVNQRFCDEFSFNSQVVFEIMSSRGFLMNKKKSALINLAIWYHQFFS